MGGVDNKITVVFGWLFGRSLLLLLLRASLGGGCCGLVASGVVDESGVQACFLDAGSVCALPTLCFLSVLAVLVRNGSNRARG